MQFAASSSSFSAQRSLLLRQDEEEEDEDEDEIPLPIVPQIEEIGKAPELAQSEECSEALQAIDSDPWDGSSWVLFLQEVEEGRSGSLTLVDAYHRFLVRFPRAAKYWKVLAEYHVKHEDYAAAEDVFDESLSKCRHVDLWLAYVAMVQSKATSSSGNDMKPVEVAFEKAIENVGMSVNATPLWRSYVDFTRERKDWTETNDVRRLAALRLIYQKALCVPQDGLEKLWKEYETLEKEAGEHLADKILPEFEGKYLHAKTVYRERRRISLRIDLDRLAVPPSNAVSELQQLGMWNKWIRYEMTNPDNLSTEQHQAFMKLIYEQCLCCMLHHPEVWMGYARLQQEAGGATVARQVYQEAIETVPDIVALRVALAELEEAEGNNDAAKAALQAAFDKLPSAFTFATLQRFVRRKETIAAARKIFSDTLLLRRDPANETLGLELCLAHAQLELDVNCCPQVALKTLELAQQTYTNALQDMRFVRLNIQVLTLRGDLRQLRWLFQTALGDAAFQLAGGGSGIIVEAINRNNFLTVVAANLITSGIAELNTGRSSRKAEKSMGGISSERSLKDQLELWDEYLKAETVLGLTDVGRLDEIRKARDKARAAFEESEKTRQAAAMGGVVGTDFTSEMVLAKVRGLFDSAYEFGERYEQLGALSLPSADASLRQRTNQRNRAGLEGSEGGGASTRLSQEYGERGGMQSSSGSSYRDRDSLGGGGGVGGRRPRGGRFEQDEPPGGNLTGLPNILRDFIPRLPTHSGPLPDIDSFVRQLRACVVPSRPSETAVSLDPPAADGEGAPIQAEIGVKRSLEEISAPSVGEVEKIEDDENPATAAVVSITAEAAVTVEAAADVVPIAMASEVVTDGVVTIHQEDDDDGDDGSPKRQRARLE